MPTAKATRERRIQYDRLGEDTVWFVAVMFVALLLLFVSGLIIKSVSSGQTSNEFALKLAPFAGYSHAFIINREDGFTAQCQWNYVTFTMEGINEAGQENSFIVCASTDGAYFPND